jgi:hypothetical protein
MRSLIKKSRVFLFASLTLTALLSAGENDRSLTGDKVSLRIYAGLNYLYGGDLNGGLAGWLDLWGHTAALLGLPGKINFVGAHWGPQAGVDVLIPLDPRLALALGAGTLSASARSLTDFPSNDVVPSSHEINIRPRAVPLRAGLAYLLPVSRSLDVRFQAGAAYYMARAEAEYNRDWSDYWEKDRYSLKARGWGYQGGIGLELRLIRWAAVFLEGQYRSARISNFSGSVETTSSEEGLIHREGELYLIDYQLAEDAVFTLLDVLDQEPSGPAFLNVKKAVVDFSGFSLNLGLTLRF